MKTKTIVFKSMDDVVNFVKKVENYPYDMDMKRGKYIVDAKSLLGLLNLGLQRKIELKVYADNCEDLWTDIEQYVAA